MIVREVLGAWKNGAVFPRRMLTDGDRPAMLMAYLNIVAWRAKTYPQHRLKMHAEYVHP